jgi:hemerythrin
MALFTWSDKFAVNILEIDAQHKRLIELINMLYDAMKQGKGKDVLGKVLADLVTYTVYHFSTEEKLFQKFGYPEYEVHKKEHDNLTLKAKDLKEKFNQGKTMITIEVMNFLKDWLNNHILNSDTQYGPFLNSKGVS